MQEIKAIFKCLKEHILHTQKNMKLYHSTFNRERNTSEWVTDIRMLKI